MSAAVKVGVDGDGQEPVLQRVVLEDVGERQGDDRANPPRRERPDRVLARRAAAEVPRRDEDREPLRPADR